MVKKIGIILLSLCLTGCGSTTKHFVINNPNAVNVKFDVSLDKGFIKDISTIGGGQAAMLILVGPFTNNAVLLVAKENAATGEKIAFRQRLSWGSNAFDVLLEKNMTYQLVVVVQGTRSGVKTIGDIHVEDSVGQHFTITLHEDRASIE
jgi:hypothetical protein